MGTVSVHLFPRGQRPAFGLRAVPLALAVLSSLPTTLAGCSPEALVGVTTELPADIALYETFELVVRGRSDGTNPFTRFVIATFSHPDEREPIRVEGFYDGEDTWRARFSPERAGEWTYSWHLGRQRGSGLLRVGEGPWVTQPTDGQSIRHRGHVHARGESRVGLVHGDGSPHFWVGAKWLSAKNYGPPEKTGESNDRQQAGSLHDAYYSDEAFEAFLDRVAKRGLNGLLLKIGLFPLEDDGVSWDLRWVQRADRWIAAMNERGIYCQITLFEPWSRKRGEPFQYSLDNNEHVLNAWSAERTADKENYVRYAIARFSGYANVYWELGNRARHPGFDEHSFVEQANEHYVRWFERYEPYDTAVALSDTDQARVVEGVGIEVPRTDTHLPAPSDTRKARIVNELVHDCGPLGSGARAYLDATIRDGAHRLCYRSAAWVAFTSGAFGVAAASWLDLSEPITPAVDHVLEDLGRLRSFVEELPVRHHQLIPDTRSIVGSSGHLATRSRPGHLYVSYFRGPARAGEVRIELPEGSYLAQWFDPATGALLAESRTQVRRTAERIVREIEHPAYDEDAVLLLRNESVPVVVR